MYTKHYSRFYSLILSDKNCKLSDSPLKSPTIPYIMGTLWGIFPFLSYSNPSADIFINTVLGKLLKLMTLVIKRDFMSLTDISKMPARVKCVVLGWHTMEEFLGKEKK